MKVNSGQGLRLLLRGRAMPSLKTSIDGGPPIQNFCILSYIMVMEATGSGGIDLETRWSSLKAALTTVRSRLELGWSWSCPG